MHEFASIRFGKTSAEKESLETPDLLLTGFFDPFQFISTAKAPGNFLFLGYKGSGKSAIGEHLRLIAENEPLLFVRYLSLGDFPYTAFSKIVKGDIEPEAKFPDAWSWLLLLQLIEQFANDQGSSLHSSQQASEMYRQLQSAGLLPSSSLKFIVQQTTKRSGAINWKALTFGREATATQGNSADIPFFVEKLKAMVLSLRSASQHFLIIDGLDELLGSRSVQMNSLASLVYEIDRLNSQFLRARCPVKILLLCRTDIYELLPNANKNKIRQDAAVELDWFSEASELRSLNLIRLANHRASVSLGRPVDIFERYFPKTVLIKHGRKDVEKDPRAFLLEFTRHTPRDLITLLNFVQRETGVKPSVSSLDLNRASKNYSVAYFVPEIRDELNGYFTPEQIAQIIALLSALAQREFTYNQISQCSEDMVGHDFELTKALYHLFECSALGNIELVNGYTYFSFKYRNRNAVLDLSKKMMLHRGMWKALNLH